MTRNSVHPYRKPHSGENASRRYTYWPPALGIIAASSPYDSAPTTVRMPVMTQATSSQPGLPKHALAGEAAVRGYARKFGEDEEAWGVAALLHDFDYERWPTLGDHPVRGSEILREKGYPEWLVRAILSHAAEITGVARESR